MLPNANGAAVAFMAVQAAGRVAAMLNFTAGSFNLIAACKTANVRIVLSSRSFVEKGKLEDIVKPMEAHVRFVWLEDLRDGATALDKISAYLNRGKAILTPAPSDPAVVLFTSGSEGAPKGVVLSHANVLANIAQISARFDFTSADIVFNPLPIFHSFGLTGGLLLGLMCGMKVYLYPTPPSLPPDSRTRLRRQRDRAVRHRHVSCRLRAHGEPLRFSHAALRRLRRRAGEGRDAPRLYGKVRPAHSRRLRRDRDVPCARRQHADVQP